jgi:two-component system, OmpR family, sensor kinase
MVLFCAVVGVLLALSYGGFYVMFERVMNGQLDRQLQDTAGPIVADLTADPEEKDIDRLDIPGQYFEVIDPSGAVQQRSANLKSQLPLSVNQPFQSIQTASEGSLRIGLTPFTADGKTGLLVVAASTREVDSALATLRRSAFVLFPIALLLTALVSGLFAAKSLKPVADVTAQATEMIRELTPSADPANASLDGIHSADELHQLTVTFNVLFDRLHSVISQLRQFVSDAAHEIRTPLSILRGESELLLSRPRTKEDYEKAIRVMDSELKKLSRIVDGLFTLSMADAGQLRIAPEPLYLEEVIEETCALAAPLANHKRIRVEKHLQRDVLVSGDAAFLRQLFLIFIDNAVKYSAPGTRLDVHMAAEKDVQIRFEDQGIGIAKENLPRIFERFFRVGQAGPQDTQSGGLGLSIAQAIVQAHRGTIECESRPGIGTVFTIRLPITTAVMK